MSDDRRLLVLQTAVLQQSGPWTTQRVRRLYARLGYNAPLRRTARRDLTQLTREGVLEQHETPGRRYYTRRRKENPMPELPAGPPPATDSVTETARNLFAWIDEARDAEERADQDDASEAYPCGITVYCDECGTEVRGDYLVTDDMTSEQRLACARNDLSTRLGWSCTEAGDFCPACTAAGGAA